MLPSYAHFFAQFLMRSWREINQEAFLNSMELPTFQIDESRGRLGFWDSRTRTLGISAQLLLQSSEVEILEVLKHEMAHQYADEVLHAGQDPSETAHGSGFRHAAARLGIQHHARYAVNQEASPILRRIQKLLALTQSENPHEAQAAMLKARDLMAKYEMDTGWEHSDLFYRYLGKGVPRKSLQAQLVATVLVRFFQVAVIWIPSEMLLKSKTVWLLEACGTPTNLEIAGYVYEFLHRELNHLWKSHQARHPHLKGQRVKRDFQVGVLKGLIEKMSNQQEVFSQSQNALIVQKKAELNGFLRQKYPDIQKGRRLTYRNSDTYQAGLEEGRQLDIHKGLSPQNKTNKALPPS